MKTILTLMACGSILAFLAPSQVQATSITKGWYCYASSPSASGWSIGPTRASAVQRALAECAQRTPRSQSCAIRYCR